MASGESDEVSRIGKCKQIPVEAALKMAARQLTSIIGLIDPDDPRAEGAIESMGSVAVTYREAAEIPPPVA